MKTTKMLRNLSFIWGIIVTLFLLLAFGPKFIGEFIKDAAGFITEIKKSFIYWENPSAFFLIYLTGYIIIWWKPLWGSIIVILASLVFVIIAGFDGPPIFALPAFLVGIFYLLYWNALNRSKIDPQKI